MLGPSVTIATAGHPILPALRRLGYQYNAPVHIGKNCWLGAGVIVLPGITIGDDTVVGAGSVVTKDIPSFSVAVGNPARVIKRYDDALGVWVKTRNPQEGIRRQDDNDNSCNSGATEP